MAALGTYAFAGVPFGHLIPDGMVTRSGVAVLNSVRHVPYSDINIVDIGGKDAQRWAGSIRILPSTQSAWNARVGASGTLILDGTEYPGSVLLSLNNPRMTPRRDYLLLEAEWVLGS